MKEKKLKRKKVEKKKTKKKRTGLKILLIILFLIIFVLGADFLVTKYMNSKNEDNVISDEEFKRTIAVSYLIMDKDNTPEGVSLDDAASTYIENVLFLARHYIFLSGEEDNYYTGELYQQNDLLLEDITDYVFSINNVEGNVIDDCIYDQDNNIIKIPKDYFTDDTGSLPVQMELVTRVSDEDMQNITITKKINSETEKIKVSGYNVTTDISIGDYEEYSYITKDDISIYINGVDTKITDDSYELDSETGTISLNMYPVLIQSIQVKIDKQSLAQKILNVTTAFASAAVDVTNGNYTGLGTAFWLTEHTDSDWVSYSYNNNEWITLPDNNSNKGFHAYYDYSYACHKNGTNSSSCSDYSQDVYDAWNSSTLGYIKSGTIDDNDGYANSFYHGSYQAYVINMASVGNKSNGSWVQDTTLTNSMIDYLNLDTSQNYYFAMFCVHNGWNTAVGAPAVRLKMRVIYISNTNTNQAGYAIVAVYGTVSAGYQAPYGIIKVSWPKGETVEASGTIKAKKKVITNNNEADETVFKFTLYSDASKTTKISTKNARNGETVSWTGLDLDESGGARCWYIQEESTNCGNNYDCDNSTHKVCLTIDKNLKNPNTGNKYKDDYDLTISSDTSNDVTTYKVVSNYLVTNPITNTKNYYCLKVLKTDFDDKALGEGFKFELFKKSTDVIEGTTETKCTNLCSSAQSSLDDNETVTCEYEDGDCTITETTSYGTKTTNSSKSIATFEYLKYQQYRLKETAAAGDYKITKGKSSWEISSGSLTFNDAGSVAIIPKTSLTKMTYSDGTYSCPATATTVTKKDGETLYCFKIYKTDAESGDPVEGVTFSTTVDGDTVSVKTDSDGYATFTDLPDKKDYTVEESKVPSGSNYEPVDDFVIKEENLGTMKDGECDLGTGVTYSHTASNTSAQYVGAIEVKKETNVDTDETFTFNLYEGKGCSGDVMSSLNVVAGSVYTFENLVAGKDTAKWYSVKEKCSTSQKNNWECDTSCRNIGLIVRQSGGYNSSSSTTTWMEIGNANGNDEYDGYKIKARILLYRFLYNLEFSNYTDTETNEEIYSVTSYLLSRGIDSEKAYTTDPEGTNDYDGFINAETGERVVTIYKKATGTNDTDTDIITDGDLTDDNIAAGNKYSAKYRKCEIVADDDEDDDEEDDVTCGDYQSLGSSGLTLFNKVSNRRKYYCIRVKKVDAENTSCAISDVEFVLTDESDNKYTLKTGTDGIATVEYLSYLDSLDIRETTKDSTELTRYCSGTGQKFIYWNNNEVTTPVSESVTEMTYNDDDGTYTCGSNASTVTKKDYRRYTYIIVSKIDGATNAALPGAQFEATCGSNTYKSTITGSDGYAIIFTSTESTDTECKIVETTTPEGYATGDDTTAYPRQLPSDTMNLTESQAKAWIETKENYSSLTSNCPLTNCPVVKNYKLLINWYKDNEDDNAIKTGATFTVKNSSGNTVKATAKESITDKSGTTKNCYVYSSSGSITEFESDSNGEVCIAKLPKGDYTITETEPAEYHTFGVDKDKTITTDVNFATKDKSSDSTTNKNRFVNYPTKIVFTKNVSNESDYSNNKITFIENGSERTVSYNELTTEELMLIEFNVYDSSGNKLSFIKTAEGVYEYAANDEDGVSGTKVTALYLNSSRQITIYHLKVGTYYISEANVGKCGDGSDKCIGYYYPNYDHSNDPGQYFTITNNYYDQVKEDPDNYATTSMTNTRTELTFTKKDFYSYYDTDDENVDFETEEERNEFDHIEFKLKDSTGYLTLVKVRDVGTCSANDKDTSYSEYRYVLSADAVLGTNGKVEGTSLYTYCGHMKITNLCRGKEYTVEEVSVPDDSVFVKENTSSTPTTSSYTIPCKDTTDTTKITEESTTTLISNKPTRVRFEKRDSKYGYLIDDETTTFNVYRCDSSVDECTPENGTLVKFSERGTINGDEEDDGVEVYKRVSDSDIEKGATYVTDLHPYKGVLVLRYLQSGYKYVLVETVSPLTYTLPQGSDAYTQFTVTSETVDVEEIDVPNKPTSILIRKYSDTGELLEGAAFKVYESTNEGSMCDSNLSAMNQPKKLLTLKTIRDGVYENRPVKDTDTVVTCTDTEDSKCSDISTASSTQLTYSTYLGTWADFAESENQDGERIELQEGEALIQYLDYGKCYIIEEVKAPTGYSLPENEEDRYTMVTIEASSDVVDTEKTLVNKPTSFTFYKYDEYNNLLDGAEFKLQKLDDNKKYQDVTVTQEEENGLLLYKVDENSTNTTITTKNGSATVYYLEPGQYRIVETKAAEGKELPKNPNVATFYVDDEGNVYGNSIIINKGKTETVEVKSSASAELIVSIQTGQTVIKYGLIIAVLVFAITGLMLLKNKKGR